MKLGDRSGLAQALLTQNSGGNMRWKRSLGTSQLVICARDWCGFPVVESQHPEHLGGRHDCAAGADLNCGDRAALGGAVRLVLVQPEEAARAGDGNCRADPGVGN